MNVKCYLVLAKNRSGKVTVRRSAHLYPALNADEALVQLELAVPDDVFDAPLFTVEVEKRDVQVGVAAVPVEA